MNGKRGLVPSNFIEKVPGRLCDDVWGFSDTLALILFFWNWYLWTEHCNQEFFNWIFILNIYIALLRKGYAVVLDIIVWQVSLMNWSWGRKTWSWSGIYWSWSLRVWSWSRASGLVHLSWVLVLRLLSWLAWDWKCYMLLSILDLVISYVDAVSWGKLGIRTGVADQGTGDLLPLLKKVYLFVQSLHLLRECLAVVDSSWDVTGPTHCTSFKDICVVTALTWVGSWA